MTDVFHSLRSYIQAQDEFEKDMEKAKSKYFPSVGEAQGADARFGAGMR